MAAELRRVVRSALEDRDKTIGIGFLVAFVITVVGANWALLTYGIVPIGFGLEAPASVYFVGLTFTFRDGLRERLGFKGALVAIAIGGILSYVLEVRQDGDLIARIAIASAAAFAVSELSDAVVYERIRERSRLLAIAGSNTVGLVVDSALFLSLAFGSLEFLTGQVVGKFYMTVTAVVLIVAWERGRRLRAAAA
ncbi:MAG: VUT family protein [Chloroflexi bacterium]|nr:VUT family protein [Chloroflexota bacterium]